MPARNVRYVGAGDETLRRNPRLLLTRPSPTTLYTADHLDPPAAAKSHFYVLSTVLSTILIIVAAHVPHPDQPKIGRVCTGNKKFRNVGRSCRIQYGFQPIVVFDGEGRFITAVLRPARRPGGKEIRAFLRRLVRAIRANWPKTKIVLRGDSHYCSPEVLDWCRAKGLDYILGVAPTPTLRRHIEDLEASTKARFEAAPKEGKARRYKDFYDGAASWSRVERIVARVEAGAQGTDTRFIVTSLKGRAPRALYENVYCRRGQAENHIKSWKTHLAADRTSCTKATANQLRLFLHAGAYWLMWGLRASMPKRSVWRVAQFDTLRLSLIKIAARVVEMKTMIRLHLPTSCPAQVILPIVLGRIPRLVT